MDLRAQMAKLPAERLAAVARSLMMQTAKCSSCGRMAQPSTPDYADLRAALEPYLAIELLKVQLQEARTCGNADRARELNTELINAYLAIKK